MCKCLLGLLILGVVAGTAAGEDTVVSILVPQSTSSIPFFEIEARNSTGDILSGVRVSVEAFNNHAQALARLLTGDVDFLFTGSSVGWGNHLSGGPIVMIGTGVWGVSSLVGNDQDYSSLSDLIGKTVALPFPGAPLDLQMRYILMENGIDPDTDLRIVYSPLPQTAGQIISGQVDAAPLPEPLATTLVVAKGLKRYGRLQDIWAGVNGGDGYSPQVSLFCTVSKVPEIGAMVLQILDAWRLLSEAIVGDPLAAARRNAEKLGQPVAVVTEAIRNTLFYVPEQAENMDRIIRYLLMIGSGNGVLPGEEFFFKP